MGLIIIIMLNRILARTCRWITSSRNDDTIYALATGVNTAVSIVRVGGNQAYRALELLGTEKVCELRQNAVQAHKIQERKAHYKKIYNSQGNIIDQCLILYFPPQKSYNKEEIIEFHVHGSRAVVASIFKQLKQKGFRMADRGEFTKRALMNGKINLVQAESINDLIKSQSEFERQIAINNMLGKNKQFLEGIRKELIKCLANNEAFIDFQDDEKDVKADLLDSTKEIVKGILKDIHKIMKNYKNLQILKQGLEITIVGKPNAGKSTLINALSQKQVAIVSEEPGTTRDILQTQIECGGVMLNLYDTAGLRHTGNKIQMEGIKRARMKIKESQINLLLIDIEQEEVKEFINQCGEKEKQILNRSEGKMDQGGFNYNQVIDKNTIVIVNKGDRLQNEERTNGKYFIRIQKPKQKEIEWDENGQEIKNESPPQLIEYKCYVDLIISAQNQKDVDNLLSFLNEKIKKQFSLYSVTEQIYFTRERYFLKLQKCSDLLQSYINENRPDIACEYLRVAIQQISQIFGKVDVEDVLDVLFKQFCIGK